MWRQRLQKLLASSSADHQGADGPGAVGTPKQTSVDVLERWRQEVGVHIAGTQAAACRESGLSSGRTYMPAAGQAMAPAIQALTKQPQLELLNTSSDTLAIWRAQFAAATQTRAVPAEAVQSSPVKEPGPCGGQELAAVNFRDRLARLLGPEALLSYIEGGNCGGVPAAATATQQQCSPHAIAGAASATEGTTGGKLAQQRDQHHGNTPSLLQARPVDNQPHRYDSVGFADADNLLMALPERPVARAATITPVQPDDATLLHSQAVDSYPGTPRGGKGAERRCRCRCNKCKSKLLYCNVLVHEADCVSRLTSAGTAAALLNICAPCRGHICRRS
jgi:hypothetical protein